MADDKKLTTRDEDFSAWYHEVIQRAELAEHSAVRGCMVIRPNGYAIWELLQAELDRRFKETGHRNAYFPLFVPESFMTKEAEHVEGFAPQCAVVTHGGGKELEEPLYIRPTSEAIIGHTYAKWVQSWRDLPILINQWANVVRWEMRTRLFLRTMEFLWQEGHTVHATRDEAMEETLRMLDVYAEVAEDVMAMPVHRGPKSESEKFAGADITYSIEAMMQDTRALQAGTSHMLGQNFAKAFEITFQDEDGELQTAWTTSWGVSTRLVGALIMAHSDDTGLMLPPMLAPIEAAIVPIWRNDEERARVLEAAESLRAELSDRRIELDDRDNMRPSAKYFEWEEKGACVRIEIGPKDLEKDQVVLVRRDNRDKEFIPRDKAGERLGEMLCAMQGALQDRARTFRDEHSHEAASYEDFQARMREEDRPGFVRAGWCGSEQCEQSVQDETKATIRNMPFEWNGDDADHGTCLKCGEAATATAVFAKSY